MLARQIDPLLSRLDSIVSRSLLLTAPLLFKISVSSHSYINVPDFQELIKPFDSSQQQKKMEGDTYSTFDNGTQIDGKIFQTFQKSFVQVQNILDQNRVLINEINQNHESKVPDNLNRNVGLIKELNNNIRRVAQLYSDLSSSFTKSIDVSSEGDSTGAVKSQQQKSTHKRHRHDL
ncbi:Protein ELF4-LIKE 2 [Trifolium repens]|nr:Protein ELF4-LIKE 2 [Trifolium repens]